MGDIGSGGWGSGRRIGSVCARARDERESESESLDASIDKARVSTQALSVESLDASIERERESASRRKH